MKNKCLIVRYGELFLKGKNRNFFIQKLIHNINLALLKNNCSNFYIRKFSDQLIITTKNPEEINYLPPILKNIFGISVFYFAYQIEKDLDKLYSFVENLTNYYETNHIADFKLDISRTDKNFSKNSLTLQKELGAIIVKNSGLKVNLSNPQKTFYICIHHEFILFFSEKIEGLRGLPVGSSGKVLLLLSGGIDSPVAAYQLMKRGLEVIYLHFYQQEEGREKISALVNELSVYNNYSETVYLADSQPFFSEIRHISQDKYRLIILKRMFIRLACLLAEGIKIKAIATGDSLAQVASQTIESLEVIQHVSSLIILWPLISWNKEEIIKEAKKIKTYEVSLRKYQDCCSLFEPRHPVTKPRKEVAEALEKEIFWRESIEAIYRKMGINFVNK